MTDLIRWGIAVFDRWTGKPRHDEMRDGKSKETQKQPLPMTTRDNIKSTEDDTSPQQQAAQKPQRRTFGRHALPYRPPKATEEHRPEQNACD